MLKRSSWILGVVGSAALCAAYQVRVNYRDQDFTLSGFDGFSATLEANAVSFEGSGAPLRIEASSRGITATGKKAVGTAQRAADRSYFLKELKLSGSGHVALDGRSGVMEPGASITDVVSESFHFTGSADAGRLEFDQAVTIDSKSTANTIHLTGSKGFLTMLLGGQKKTSLQTGELAGPVEFTLTKAASGKEPGTHIQGSGDKLSFNFITEPATVTLEGNVKANGTSAVFTGDLSADSMVVSLDAQMQPTKIEVKGSPAKTHATDAAGKGGTR